MPVIDMNDFTTQVISAVLAGFILLLVQRSWMRNATSEAASEVVPTGHRNASGNQAVFSDSQITGGVHVDQSYKDESQHTTIIHNMENSPDASASDDTYGKVVLLLIGMAVAAFLFVLLRPLLEAMSYGVVVSTVVMALVAVYRTQKLHEWSFRAVATIVTVAGAAIVAVLTWRAMGSLAHEGMSLDAIRGAIPAFANDPNTGTIANYFDYLANSAFPSFFGVHDHVLPFVMFLLIAATAMAALCLIAVSAVWDWNAFLSFSSGSQQKRHLVARAKSYNEGGAWGLLLGAVILAAVAILSANGFLFDFFLNLTSG